MLKKWMVRLAVWLLAKSLEDLAEEYLDDGDALRMRTRIIEAIQKRQNKLAARKGNGFVRMKARCLRYASIVLDSGRLRGAAADAEVADRYINHGNHP